MIRFITIFILIASGMLVYADEGLWIPLLLKETCYDHMREQGLLLSDNEIYSENKASLKDAVVIFGSGCTGVIVSNEGLLFTNHHCAYSYVQKQSSLEHNYLDSGFWAYNKSEELPVPTLSVSVLLKMEDVTDDVLAGIDPDTDSKERETIIKKNSDEVINRKSVKHGKNYLNTVKPLYAGNRHFLYCYEVFRDIRLVGVPPTAIGKFGKDSDNWTWPRHTGDFAIFRIYADTSNQPADYAVNNIPYYPKKSVPIAMRDVSDPAFSFVMGYPSYTHRFITSYGLDLVINESYSQRAGIYEICLNTWNTYMKTDPQRQIQYATKYASASNVYKRLTGIISGIKQVDGVSKKRKEEDLFTQRVASSPVWNKQYGHLMDEFKTYHEKISKYLAVHELLYGGHQFIELFRHADKISKHIDRVTEQTPDSEIEKFIEQQRGFYLNFNAAMDKDLFIKLTTNVYQQALPEFYYDFYNGSNREIDMDSLANVLYGTSTLLSIDSLRNWMLRNKRQNAWDNDPAIWWVKSINQMYDEKVRSFLSSISKGIDSLYKIYTHAQLHVFPEKKRYPDANQTLRISYGKIEGYSVDDTTHYNSYTDIDGLIEKVVLGYEDYNIPLGLKDLYLLKDYGIYGTGNSLPLCFITTAHTSSGNSGSPVFNGKGELVGLNFDRNWEGTMSDILYDPAICRNIVVDTRYILFIMDKFAKAKHLLDELTIHIDN
jgi:hypothetical protein